jgi:hypothetical protein
LFLSLACNLPAAGSSYDQQRLEKEDSTMKARLLYSVIFVTLLGLMFTGCSKSSSDSGTPAIPGPGGGGGNTTLSTTVAVGAMTKGSVKVNGVEFQTNADTIITADDNPKAATFLDDGMTVKVKGTVNADGLTGAAEKVAVVSEARGAIAAPTGTDTVTVHGQTVLIDGGTVLAGGLTKFADLGQGENIEVHGGRDDTGVIHATRVEKLAAGAVDNELRGAVSGKTATTFAIGGLAITFGASTVLVPASATFADGDVVQVHLNGNTATQIAVEDLDHPEFEPVEGKEFSIEGILSSYGTASVFNVGTQQVQLGSTATIVGGVLADLVNGVKVEAEGHTVTGGVLTAEKITIEENIRIETNAETAGSANVLGKTVAINSGTRLTNLASSTTITAGDGLRIRGFINRDGATITATRLEKLSNSVAANKIILQGPVKNIDATAHTFSILGISINAGSSTARPNDDNGTDTLTMPLADFFSALAADRTIVKVKGTFSGGTLTASEIELE